MKMDIRQEPGENAIFGANAFDSQVGKVIPLNTPWGKTGALIVAAEVIDDGKAAMITLDIPDEIAKKLNPSKGPKDEAIHRIADVPGRSGRSGLWLP